MELMELQFLQRTLSCFTESKNCAYNISQTYRKAQQLSLENSVLSWCFTIDRWLSYGVSSRQANGALERIGNALLFGLCALPYLLDRYALWPLSKTVYGFAYSIIMALGVPTYAVFGVINAIGIPFEGLAKLVNYVASALGPSSVFPHSVNKAINIDDVLTESTDRAEQLSDLISPKNAPLLDEALSEISAQIARHSSNVHDMDLEEGASNPTNSAEDWLSHIQTLLTSGISEPADTLFRLLEIPSTLLWLLKNTTIAPSYLNFLNPQTLEPFLHTIIRTQSSEMIDALLAQPQLDLSVSSVQGATAWTLLEQRWIKSSSIHDFSQTFSRLAQRLADLPALPIDTLNAQAYYISSQKNTGGNAFALYDVFSSPYEDAKKNIQHLKHLSHTIAGHHGQCGYLLSLVANKDIAELCIALQLMKQNRIPITLPPADYNLLSNTYAADSLLAFALHQNNLEAAIALLQFDSSPLLETSTEYGLCVLENLYAEKKFFMLGMILSIFKEHIPTETLIKLQEKLDTDLPRTDSSGMNLLKNILADISPKKTMSL